MKQRPWSSHLSLRAPLFAAFVALGCQGGMEAPTSEATPPTPPPATGTPDPTPPVDGSTPTPTPPPPDGGTEPTPAPAPEPPGSPAAFLDLRDWKITLPIDTSHSGSPDEILQPELATYVLEPYFHLNAEKNAVVFRAPVEGATTSSSGYPRSELREMADGGTKQASWSTTSGTHTLVLRQAITHLPAVKRHVVAGQVHDASDDVIMIRLEGANLFVEGGGADLGTLDPAYTLGTVFTVKVVASGGHIKVYYNDVLKVDVARAATGCYFKAGAYTQSNLAKGDAPGAYGEVVLYDLKMSHE